MANKGRSKVHKAVTRWIKSDLIALLPFGLHHIWNVPFFFEIGEFTTAKGQVVTGDVTRFMNGDPTAGILGGGYLFKMFGLPAAAA